MTLSNRADSSMSAKCQYRKSLAYWITSSAVICNVSGNSRPSALRLLKTAGVDRIDQFQRAASYVDRIRDL